MDAKSLQPCLTLCNPRTVAHQAPLSMGFSRQEYWSGLPCPPPGDLPDPAIELESHISCIGRFFTTSATWEAWRLGSVNTEQMTELMMPGAFAHPRLSFLLSDKSSAKESHDPGEGATRVLLVGLRTSQHPACMWAGAARGRCRGP